MNIFYKSILNKYVQKLLLLTWSLLLMSVVSVAQVTQPANLTPSKKVEGLIKLEDSEDVAIGASVQIKGKSKGTIVDINGNFLLNVSPSDTLIISFVGYKNEVIPVGNLTQLNLSLKPDT